MSKTITGKKVEFKVWLYWRGKRRTPSVGVQYEGKNYPGLPDKIDDSKFREAARELCERLISAGELD